MATSLAAPKATMEDPLVHLPCSSLFEYRRGQVIYAHNQPSTNLYLVVNGTVKVSRIAETGRQVVVGIYQTDDFFGESALLHSIRDEEAAALEDATVMTWTGVEIQELIGRRPALGVALIQILVQRSIESARRIESFSLDNVPKRLARTLIRLSERFGRRQDDGAMQIMPLTHELLSQFVGTSREIITYHMNHLRRGGYLRYSRKAILLYREPLEDWLGSTA